MSFSFKGIGAPFIEPSPIVIIVIPEFFTISVMFLFSIS